MSDVEFLRVAEGVVGMEVLDEALHRLSERLGQDGDNAADIMELELAHDGELEDMADEHHREICRLESRIADLEYQVEHA
jgi:hypothetical protein